MRPDPIAALAEAWGRECDAMRPTRLDLGGGWWGEADTREPAEAARQRLVWASAKRARKAAKRAEDERRTAEGRVHLWVRLRPRRAFWDWCEWRIRNGEWHVRNGSAIGEPRWRIRSRERRANPALYMRDRGAL